MSPAGQQVTLTLDNPGPLSDLLAAGQTVATELGTLGISVTQVSEFGREWQSDQATGNYDIAVRPSVAGPGPYYMYNYWLNSNLTAPVGTSASGDFERFKSPAADKLLSRVRGDGQLRAAEADHVQAGGHRRQSAARDPAPVPGVLGRVQHVRVYRMAGSEQPLRARIRVRPARATNR